MYDFFKEKKIKLKTSGAGGKSGLNFDEKPAVDHHLAKVRNWDQFKTDFMSFKLTLFRTVFKLTWEKLCLVVTRYWFQISCLFQVKAEADELSSDNGSMSSDDTDFNPDALEVGIH